MDARVRRKSQLIRYDSHKAVRLALIELCVYVLFLVVTTIVAMSTLEKYMFHLNKSVQTIVSTKSFKNSPNDEPLTFADIVTTAEWWSFLERKFLDDLFEENEYRNGTAESQVEQPDVKIKYTYLRENILLGPPRLRQVRVTSDSCIVDSILHKYFTSCYASYSSDVEDKRKEFKGTEYRTLDDLNAYSIWGKIATYNSGGYVQDLTYDKEKNKEILAKLKEQLWIDRGTRMVLVEFNLYNANTGLFDSAKFIAEQSPTGGIITSTSIQVLKFSSIWKGDGYIILIAAIIFYAMVFNYTMEELRELKTIGLRLYLQSIWNAVDSIIIACAYFSLAYTIWHLIYTKNLIDRIITDYLKFISFDKICFWYEIYQDVMAFCAFFVWIKIFKFISFNKNLIIFSTTLRRCSKDLMGFGVMFGIVFLAYAQLGLLLFGTSNPDFRNFKESVVTMVRMILGDFDYERLETGNRVLGPIYFLTYILLVFFILLNMFLAILCDTYTGVRRELRHGKGHLKLFISKVVGNMWKKVIKPTSEDEAPQEASGANVKSVENKWFNFAHNKPTTDDAEPSTSALWTREFIRDVIREHINEYPSNVDPQEIKRFVLRYGEVILSTGYRGVNIFIGQKN